MRLRSQEIPLDPEIERELEELESELGPELRAMRQLPAEDFAAELDERAAAGFPGGRDPLGRLLERLRAAPRRKLGPVLAGATAVAVVGTAVVIGASGIETGQEGGDGGEPATVAEEPALDAVSGAEESSAGEGGVAAFDTAERNSTEPESAALSAEAAGQYSAPPPSAPAAAGRDRRQVERGAELILGTEPKRVRDVADDVFAIVGQYRGIVRSSQIRDGAEGVAGAEFELALPSARLSAALADLAEIAEVRSREESSLDITAPYVSVQERMQDTRALIKSLLNQLEEADTEDEQRRLQGQIAYQRERYAGLRSTFEGLQRRANLSEVSVEIVTGDAVSFGGDEGGAWTIGDALDDAGTVLTVAAGVALVSAAVLLPLALLALLLWLGRRGWVSASRERALSEG